MRRPSRSWPAGIVARLALVAAVAGCGATESTRQPGPPTAVTIVSSPSGSAAAGTSAGDFVVRVADAGGTPVGQAVVTFVPSGAASAAPGSVTTDASGVARSAITAGTTTGVVQVTASVAGTALGVVARLTVVAGPAARLQLVPRAVQLRAVGDTARLAVVSSDAFGNVAPSAPAVFTALDPAVVTVTAAGTVRAERPDSVGRVVATSGVLADTAVVTVVAAGASPCAGLATVRSLAVGESASFQGVAAGCFAGTPSGAEFALVAYNADTVNAASTVLSGVGLGTPPSGARLASAGMAPLARRGDARPATLAPDAAFHRRLMLRERALAPRYGEARAWMHARGTGGSRGPLADRMPGPDAPPRFSAIGAAPVVGDLVQLNVNGNDDCINPDVRPVRVMAVGAHAIVMADTSNPAGGFTAADYQRYAAHFDTLIYPVDVGSFGAPTDIDGNGRVGILFTRAVNELTPAGGSSYVGGFFYSRDLFPRVATPPFASGCAGSNEGELFYLLAPDPQGVVHGNVRTLALVDQITAATIAHEFQHLINASRRIYVNGASTAEVVWLDEGLSHEAEELFYYREAGKGPRQNLTDADIRLASSANYTLWKQDAAQNFGRFGSFLDAPSAGSPDALNDNLSTRGATWSFLRYAADRLYPTDGDVWYRLVNSTTSGLATLRLAFGPDPVGLMRDWAAANYLDDLGVTSDPRFSHPSWNFRDIYSRTFIRGVYPLIPGSLAAGGTPRADVQHNSAAYFRFAVPANAEGLVRFSGTGSAPPAPFQFLVIRTR